MTLFDFSTTYVENMTESGGGAAKLLVSAVVGFLLKTMYDEWGKKKESDEIGETFKLQIDSFKEIIAKQARTLNQRLAYVKTHEDKRVPVYFTDNFELIKSLNKITLVKYFKKQHKKEASAYVVKVYNNLAVLKLEIDRLIKGVNNYNNEKNIFIKAYSDNLNTLNRYFARYTDSNSQETLDKDDILQAYMKLNLQYVQGKFLDCKYIMSIQEELHKKLFDYPFNFNSSPTYVPVFEFNIKSRDIIQHYERMTIDYERVLTVVIDALKETYTELYNEKLNLADGETIVGDELTTPAAS